MKSAFAVVKRAPKRATRRPFGSKIGQTNVEVLRQGVGFIEQNAVRV